MPALFLWTVIELHKSDRFVDAIASTLALWYSCLLIAIFNFNFCTVREFCRGNCIASVDLFNKLWWCMQVVSVVDALARLIYL